MKKLLVFILIMTFAFSFGIISASAEDGTVSADVNTEIFLPTSYLQYYKLNKPIDICYDETDGVVAILESDSIIIYKDDLFTKIPMVSLNATTIAKSGNFILYLSQSHIFTIDLNNNFKLNDTNIACSSSISVKNGLLVYNTNNTIEERKITDNSEALELSSAVEDVVSYQSLKTSVVMLSKTGKIYYSKSDINNIYAIGSDDTVAQASNVRYITEDADSDDGLIYFSSESGIYSVAGNGTLTAIKKTSVNTEANNELGNLLEPNGICVKDHNLWVVDSYINAVQEINLKDYRFTEFAITTNSVAVNRLTDKASDICIDGNSIFALDNDRIIKIENINEEKQVYKRILLGETANCFAAYGNYIAYSTGSVLKILKITNETDPDAVTETILNKSVSDISDITCSDGVFYYLKNKLSGSTMFTVVCKAEVNKITENYSPEEITQFEGLGEQITSDIFDTLYIAVKDNKDDLRNVWEYTTERKKITSFSNEILNLQADFNGNLYVLLDNDILEKYSSDGVKAFSKKLKISPNLSEISAARSMCLSYASKYAYFIFNGLILNSSVETDLDISTPADIRIPENFALTCSETISAATLTENSKIFEINISDLSGECFKFVQYITAGSKIAGEQFIIIPVNDKYSIALGSVAAIVRTTDITPTENFMTPQSNEKYSVNKSSVYIYPILSDSYASYNIEKYDKLEIKYSLAFNGKNYYYVIFNGKPGFIPQSFLIDNIITETPESGYKSAYIYAKNGVAVYSEKSSETVSETVFGIVKVTVLSEDNGIMRIKYGDNSYGYVSNEYIYSCGRKYLINSAVIGIISLSLMLSLLFMENAFLFKK